MLNKVKEFKEAFGSSFNLKDKKLTSYIRQMGGTNIKLGGDRYALSFTIKGDSVQGFVLVTLHYGGDESVGVKADFTNSNTNDSFGLLEYNIFHAFLVLHGALFRVGFKPLINEDGLSMSELSKTETPVFFM